MHALLIRRTGDGHGRPRAPMVRPATERGCPVCNVRGLVPVRGRMLQLQTARRRCVLFISPDTSPRRHRAARSHFHRRDHRHPPARSPRTRARTRAPQSREVLLVFGGSRTAAVTPCATCLGELLGLPAALVSLCRPCGGTIVRITARDQESKTHHQRKIKRKTLMR